MIQYKDDIDQFIKIFNMRFPWCTATRYDWLIVIVHKDEDYLPQIDKFIETSFLDLCASTYIIHMYSSIPDHRGLKRLCEQYSNFRFTQVPELLFANIYKYQDKIITNNDFIGNNAKQIFCNLNLRPNIFREEIFNHLYNNYQDCSYLSWNSEPYFKNFQEDNFQEIRNTYVYDDYDKYYKYPITGFLFDIFAEPYLDNFVAITEKTLKGYLHGCIPVPFSNAGTNVFLKQLGFDIFEDIVNFDYLLETNNHIRMIFYLKEIDRLSEISLDICNTLTERFSANRQCFINNTQKAKVALSWIDDQIQIALSNRYNYLGY